MPADVPRVQAKAQTLHPLVAQLVAARLAARLTQRALAERSSISYNMITGIERGERYPSLVTLWAWALACGVSELKVVGDGV
jgi:transcriptional regulator with XRE-family HTH domain